MATDEGEIVVNEFLYFVTNALQNRTNNKIIDVCVRFYSVTDISTSKDKLWEIVKDSPSVLSSNLKKISRRGVKEAENNVDDMIQWLKTVDDAWEKLPRFASLDMTKIPKTDDGSLTNAQILTHHDNLRKEFVTNETLKLCLNDLKTEIIASLKNDTPNNDPHLLAAAPQAPRLEPLPISSQISLFTQADSVDTSNNMGPWQNTRPSRRHSATLPSTHSAAASGATSHPAIAATLPSTLPSTNSEASAAASGATTHPDGIAATSTRAPLFAASSKPRQQPPPLRPNRSRSRNGRSTVFIGSKVTSGQISFKGADLTVDRYIGKIDVEADNDEVKKFITDAGVKLVDFQENSRSHSSFKSFKVTVRRSDLPTLEKDNFWPAGVIFRNFFRPRGQRGNQPWSGGDGGSGEMATPANAGATLALQNGR